MRTKTNKTFVVIALMAMLVAGAQSVYSQTQRPTEITQLRGKDTLTVMGMVINNFGLGKPVMRWLNNKVFLSNTGPGLIGKVQMTVTGQAGKRLLMMFCVYDENGNPQDDASGQTSYFTPMQIPSDRYSCEVEVRIPYMWIDLQKKPTALQFGVAMYDFDSKRDNALLGMSVITMDPASIESLLGGSDTAGHTCMRCGGTGLCEYCGGIGFLRPSLCENCSQNPGICSSCGGSVKLFSRTFK